MCQIALSKNTDKVKISNKKDQRSRDFLCIGFMIFLTTVTTVTAVTMVFFFTFSVLLKEQFDTFDNQCDVLRTAFCYSRYILGQSKSWSASKLLYWVKSYGNFGERGDFTYGWKEGSALQPAQPACFNMTQIPSAPWLFCSILEFPTERSSVKLLHLEAWLSREFNLQPGWNHCSYKQQPTVETSV